MATDKLNVEQLDTARRPCAGRPELLMLCYICLFCNTNTNTARICDDEYYEISRQQYFFSTV